MKQLALSVFALTWALAAAAPGQDIPVTPPAPMIPVLPPGPPPPPASGAPVTPLAPSPDPLSLIFGENAPPPEKPLDIIIPLEMLPVEAALTQGQIWKTPMRRSPPAIAFQPARTLRAVTVVMPKNRSWEKKPHVFALLGPFKKKADGSLDLDVPREQQAWCVFDFTSTVTDCYQDVDGDGKFESSRRAIFENTESAGQVELGADHVLPKVNALPTPLEFHELPPEQTPRYQLGYVSCSNDAADIRFGVFAKRIGDGGDINANIITSACHLRATEIGAAPEGGKLYKFDRFVVRVYEDGRNTRTQLVTGITPGTILGQVTADRPLTDAANLAPYRTVSEQYPGKRALAFINRPAIVKAGPVKPGDEIINGEVAPGITGTLAAPLFSGGWLATKLLAPAGAPVYALPMKESKAADVTLVWCAPAKTIQGKWQSVCLPRAFGSYMIYDKVDAAFAPSGFRFSPALRGSTSPVVEPGPVDFGGPLLLSLRFDGWEKDRFKLTLHVSPNGEPGGESVYTGALGANGRARLDFNAGTVLFAATPDDPTSITVTAVQQYTGDKSALGLPQR